MAEPLVLDVIGQLEDDVERNPLDYRKWQQLIEAVLAKDKKEQVRLTFDKYLSIFKIDVCLFALTTGEAVGELHQL